MTFEEAEGYAAYAGPAAIVLSPGELGCMMSKQLGDDDALAVDLLLDRSNQVSDGNGGSGTGVYVTPVGDAVTKRIGAVESVLRLVAEMPAAEPPADLVARTLDRIGQRANQGMMAPGAAATQGQPQQPIIGQGPRHA